jgi:cyclophilin family peptidyl-prolyl cis-trans isomerase
MSHLRLIVASLCLVPVSAAIALQAEQPAGGSADHGLKPHVKIQTNKGAITLELEGEKAPISTGNFLQYAEAGFYDGTIFHRVIKDFMIQGGGFTTDLMQKKQGLRPGIQNEWKNGLKNNRGTIAMARVGGNPDSGTSQFFINTVDNERLDKPQGDGAAYTVFGKVVEGMDVVDTIRESAVDVNPKLGGEKAAPVEPIIIEKVSVVGSYDREGLKKKVEAAGADKAKAGEASKKLVADELAKAEAELGQKGTTTPSGLAYVDVKVGEGDTPKPTDVIAVDYTVWLLDGTELDSSKGKQPYPVTLARGGVIQGWLEALSTMKAGGKRRLIIPPDLAYGAQGRPPRIPPHSVLKFDVEVVSIKGQGSDE